SQPSTFNSLMLTHLATIKSRLGLDPFDTAGEPLLTSLLKHVSARFAAECNRIFDYGAGLTYEFRADQLNILVDHPPIELVSLFQPTLRLGHSSLAAPSRHCAYACHPRGKMANCVVAHALRLVKLARF